MSSKINAIFLTYANKIAEGQSKLEYYLNHDNLFEEEISEVLGQILDYEAKIGKLKFYLDNNNDVG